ncbi:hypothetical protein, partial [Pseudomonas syringae group genomosp. 7]|uniref:hypothetical protein n=1 Tax=Pseudomonas syringae group genomosp. 7 TaxID=251699 RepID=UPI00376F957D
MVWWVVWCGVFCWCGVWWGFLGSVWFIWVGGCWCVGCVVFGGFVGCFVGGVAGCVGALGVVELGQLLRLYGRGRAQA